MVLGGWALVKTAAPEGGAVRLCAGIDALATLRARTWRLLWLPLLVEVCLDHGRIEEGLSAVQAALGEVEETEARICDAELHRLHGELLFASKESDGRRAEASFRKAVSIARGQDAKSWELRAATSFARLLARQGKREEARGLLAPVYGWFTEGFATKDLQEAKAFLDELSEGASRDAAAAAVSVSDGSPASN
jgi:predicted ATPase